MDPWTGSAIDAEECFRLLTTSRVGRLAFTERALPAVVPVPYSVHDRHVVVPTLRGSPMAAAVRRAVVAFQVDSYRGGPRPEWSVTAVGPSRVIADLGDVTALGAPAVGDPLAADDRCFIVVRVEMIDGWRSALPLDPAPGAHVLA